ncbi:MAG TPA: sugar transferase [Methylomirabilota bacterium]|nr:sugar transferase [Methylomirabilota bacterium]
MGDLKRVNGDAAGGGTMASSAKATDGSEVIPPARPLPKWKACLDATVIFLISPILVPLMAVIALWIKLVSRGPVIFRQERVGYLGTPFTILKFRTMHVGASAGTHQHHVASLIHSEAPMIKMDTKGDARLIPMGVWLRATGLDELPQLINVLRGDMSLVGPRPCTFYELEHYLPWHKERFNALPGLTGLWQVSGKNRTTFTQMMNLDIQYVRNVSFKLDLIIMAKTFSVLVGQLTDAAKVKWGRWFADKQAVRTQDHVVSLPGTASSGR